MLIKTDNKNCVKCKKPAKVFRKQSGQYLCHECFTTSIEKVVSKTISKYNLYSQQDSLAVPLACHPNALVLIYLLQLRQSRTYKSNVIKVFIIDEGIKNYSKDKINSLVYFCKNLEISYEIISFKDEIGMTLDDVIKLRKNDPNNSPNPCQVCIMIQDHAISRIMRNSRFNVLASPLDLSDISRVFLYNLLKKRYKTITSLFSFPSFQVGKILNFRIIHPLMRIPKNEVNLYAYLKGIDTRLNHCVYEKSFTDEFEEITSNFIDKCKNFSPEIEYNLFKSLEEISRILLKHQNNETFKFCESCGTIMMIDGPCQFCELIKGLKK